MFFNVDHIVFAAEEAEQRNIRSLLESYGFPKTTYRLDFPDVGGASESVAYGDGGFLEFAFPTGGAGEFPSIWRDQGTRVMGLGFASDDFDQDTPWRHSPEAWMMDAEQGFPNSAGPHEHISDVYTFAMNRPDRGLQFPVVPRAPRLVEMTLSGRSAHSWLDDLARWYALPGEGSRISCGPVNIVAEDGPHANIRVSLSFATGGPSRVVPLAGGEIRLLGG